MLDPGHRGVLCSVSAKRGCPRAWVHLPDGAGSVEAVHHPVGPDAGAVPSLLPGLPEGLGQACTRAPG